MNAEPNWAADDSANSYAAAIEELRRQMVNDRTVMAWCIELAVETWGPAREPAVCLDAARQMFNQIKGAGGEPTHGAEKPKPALEGMRREVPDVQRADDAQAQPAEHVHRGSHRAVQPGREQQCRESSGNVPGLQSGEGQAALRDAEAAAAAAGPGDASCRQDAAAATDDLITPSVAPAAPGATQPAGDVPPEASSAGDPIDQKAEARRRMAAGESWSAVARDLGCAESTLRRWCADLDIPPRKVPNRQAKRYSEPSRHECVAHLRERNIKFTTAFADDVAGGHVWVFHGKRHGLTELRAFVVADRARRDGRDDGDRRAAA